MTWQYEINGERGDITQPCSTPEQAAELAVVAYYNIYGMTARKSTDDVEIFKGGKSCGKYRVYTECEPTYRVEALA